MQDLKHTLSPAPPAPPGPSPIEKNKNWEEETLGNVETIMRKKKGENDQKTETS